MAAVRREAEGGRIRETYGNFFPNEEFDEGLMHGIKIPLYNQ